MPNESNEVASMVAALIIDAAVETGRDLDSCAQIAAINILASDQYDKIYAIDMIDVVIETIRAMSGVNMKFLCDTCGHMYTIRSDGTFRMHGKPECDSSRRRPPHGLRPVMYLQR